MIDSHVHLAGAATHPSGERYVSASELVGMMDACGIRAAIAVAYLGLTDNSCLLQGAATYPERLRPVVYLDWRLDGAAHALAGLSEAVAGVRLETHARSPGADPLQIWRTAHELGLPVSAQGGRSPRFWAEHLTPVLVALPGLAVRIEHLARPEVADGVRSPAFQAVLRLSAYEHVAINVDGLWAVSKRPHPYEDVLPFAEAAIAAFGADRVMWGSDVPYALDVHTYAAAQAEIRSVLGVIAAAREVDVMLDAAPARFWGLDGGRL